MEILLSIAIGVLVATGCWLIMRPRTFQVILGLSLLSYGINLFIFSSGGIRKAAVPILPPVGNMPVEQMTDPLPQGLVLTAIVIGFATTALLLVVLLTLRGFSGADHVDGMEPRL
jgi:Multisubunit Na+/H+ antiporter, MnhC subunit